MNDSNGIEVKLGDVVKSIEGFTYEVVAYKDDRWFVNPIHGSCWKIDLNYLRSFEIVDDSLHRDAAKYRELKDTSYVQLVEAVKRLYGEQIMMPDIVREVDVLVRAAHDEAFNTLKETLYERQERCSGCPE